MLACATRQLKLAASLLDFSHIKTNMNDEDGENALCKILKLPNPPEGFAKELIARGCQLTPKAQRILRDNATLNLQQWENLLDILQTVVKEKKENEEKLEIKSSINYSPSDKE